MSPKSETNRKNVVTRATVSRQYFIGKEPSSPMNTKNEELEVNVFVTEPAKVSVSEGLTLNLGNFESARLDVSIALPCYVEEVEEAYKFAKNWVESRLHEEVASVRKNKPDLF